MARLRRIYREYTGGVAVGEMPRQLGRDASRAYGILTREHAEKTEPESGLRRFFHRVKIVFLGLSFKLSPARRILFVLCLVLAVVGVQRDSSNGIPMIMLLSLGGMTLLLALELADRIMVRDELEVARELQRELLPITPPLIAGYEVAFSYETANTIGGDYYDFLPVADGRVAVVVGDASGHGIAAGLIMAIANTTLKMALDLDPRPLAVTTMVNRALVRTGGPRAFMTLFFALLDPSTGAMEYVCSGHPYPLVRRADGRLSELGSGSLPLGIRDELELTQASATLEPGDTLVMYTDGIPEAVDADREAYGFVRLERAVGLGGSAAAVHDRLMGELRTFQGAEPTLDDRSLVVMTRQSAGTGAAVSDRGVSD